MIVILGHTGFIGSHLLGHFAQGGWPVLGLASRECDLTRSAAVRQALGNLPEKFDLINCAVINREHAGDYASFAANCRMLQNLAGALAGRCRSFIQLSSVDVYGLRPPLPLSEAVVPDPADYYALAKFTGEGLLRLGLEAACPLAVLRLPGVYGPADQGRSLVGGLVRKILAGQSVLLSGQGRLRRDCLAVADLAWIVERLLETPRPLLVNVASGDSFSLLELVALIGEIGGVRPEVSLAGDETGERRGDLVYDLGLLRRKFPQFRPRPLRQGIAEYVAALGG